MNYRYLFAAAVLTAMFAACSDDGGGDGNSPSLCDALCECQECTSDQRDACDAQEDASFEQAKDLDCEGEYEDYLACAENDGQCVSGTYHVPGWCDNEQQQYVACVGSPSCPTTNNGVCDEPGGNGNGLCPTGTDTNDCHNSCPTTNNGVCDEPEGTGTCPQGTDAADCATGNCPYTNDGECDEPEGTGLCPEGTDYVDCNNTSCDTGDPSGANCQDSASGCLACALAGSCSDEYDTCASNEDCIAFVTCIAPTACDQVCVDQCATDHPTGETLYNDLVYCAICEECPIDCDGAQSGCL
jgi:hypothetical protein